jgi:hypothetical protein
MTCFIEAIFYSSNNCKLKRRAGGRAQQLKISYVYICFSLEDCIVRTSYVYVYVYVHVYGESASVIEPHGVR